MSAASRPVPTMRSARQRRERISRLRRASARRAGVLFVAFYSRSSTWALNTAGRWNLHHLHPSRPSELAIWCACWGASADWLGPVARIQPALWRVVSGPRFLLALAALGLQCGSTRTRLRPATQLRVGLRGWDRPDRVNILVVLYGSDLARRTLHPRAVPYPSPSVGRALASLDDAWEQSSSSPSSSSTWSLKEARG